MANQMRAESPEDRDFSSTIGDAAASQSTRSSLNARTIPTANAVGEQSVEDN